MSPPAVPQCEHFAPPGGCTVRGCGNHPTDYVRSSDVAANAAAVDEARAAPPRPFGTVVDANGVCDHGYPPDRCVVSNCPNHPQFRARFPHPGGPTESVPLWTPSENAARALLELVDLCTHEQTSPPARGAHRPGLLLVCLDCGASSVETGAWRPPALHAKLRAFVEDVEQAAIDRAMRAPVRYPQHAPHLAPIVKRLDAILEQRHERSRNAERLEELLLATSANTTQREAHYLRQLEHGSRILERFVELVAPAPVVYRGERLAFPESELEKRYREARSAMVRPGRSEIVVLLEELEAIGLRVADVLATSVPFASLRRWACDLQYPRAALAELLGRLDSSEAGAHIDPRVRSAAFDLFTNGAAAGEISAVTGLAADVVDELLTRWRTGKA